MSYAKWVNISHYFKRVLQKYWIHKGTKISAHNSQLPAQDEVHHGCTHVAAEHRLS